MPQSLLVISANTSWYLYNFRKNLILALIDKGYRILAVAPKDQYSEKLVELGCTFEHISIDQRGLNPFKELLTILTFYKIYRRHRPRLVLNFTPKNNIYGTMAAARLRIPCINNIAGLGTVFINEGLTARIARLLYKFSQRYAHKIFFQNEEDMLLFRQANIASSTPCERLPGSGVDLKRFQPSHRNDDGTVIFILIARLIWEKGIAEYVEAARVLKANHLNTEFRLLGFLDSRNSSAVTRKTVMEWHAHGHINYLGVSDHVETEIAQADCVVLPSYYREGVPKSLLEGAAMAKPLVTTNNVGCREVVEEGFNGFLCKARDVDDLCLALRKIAEMSHAARRRLGENSRVLIERKFDETIIIKKYLAAVIDVVSP